jgi:hypothetical protein
MLVAGLLHERSHLVGGFRLPAFKWKELGVAATGAP